MLVYSLFGPQTTPPAFCAAFFIALLGTWAPAQESDFTVQQLTFFEQEIRPVLVRECLSCHSGSDPKGGLRLETREQLLKGGESGPGAVSGESSQSLLWHAVNYDDLEMPPEGKLSANEIESLQIWIDQGLAWPTETQLAAQRLSKSITDEDRNYWAFRPLAATDVPMVRDGDWCRSTIDAFILNRLEAVNLSPAPAASLLQRLRRVSFDLTGLPPTEQQLYRLIDSPTFETFEALVEEMLSSPQFGEHWGQYWLDLVRYADSDGYKADGFRPLAWKYRDYVIDSFNTNRPMNEFFVQQLAGDLLPDTSPENQVATGYLRNWIYEYNQRDAKSQWQFILDDVTEVTSDVFLGLGMGCAKCHDHKYDPLLQTDYYRLQACFSNILPDDELLATDPETKTKYLDELSTWETRTAELRQKIERLESPTIQSVSELAINKFPPDIKELFDRAPEDLSTQERQLVYLANLQVRVEIEKIDFSQKLKDAPLAEWQALQAQWKEQLQTKPQRPSIAWGVTELKSDARYETEELRGVKFSAGIPEVLALNKALSDFPTDEPKRLALAKWVVSNDNPTTARVMVNRVWERLMGRGLAPNPNDFGQLSGPPSHPELLDHLAFRWRDQGWNFKQLIREIILSSTYQMSTDHPDFAHANELDPENQLYWHAHRRRLSAGQIRDALLLASGDLDSKSGGPAQNHDTLRRTIYMKVLRNQRELLLDAFDFPDRIRSQGRRNNTTTPLQALLLINGDWSLARATALANKVRSIGGDDPAQGIQSLFTTTLGRPASTRELDLCQEFLNEHHKTSMITDDATRTQQAWTDLCHSLLNSNEFIYLD
jgi:hypothetical protein